MAGMNRRLAPAMFAITAFAYMVAVTQRSSLGVAGVLASERFDVGATALSTLAVAQLAVYAALQIPVGMLLDRFGPARLILVGALLMSGGQLIVALAPELSVAVVGRMLVGAGMRRPSSLGCASSRPGSRRAACRSSSSGTGTSVSSGRCSPRCRSGSCSAQPRGLRRSSQWRASLSSRRSPSPSSCETAPICAEPARRSASAVCS